MWPFLRDRAGNAVQIPHSYRLPRNAFWRGTMNPKHGNLPTKTILYCFLMCRNYPVPCCVRFSSAIRSFRKNTQPPPDNTTLGIPVSAAEPCKGIFSTIANRTGLFSCSRKRMRSRFVWSSCPFLTILPLRRIVMRMSLLRHIRIGNRTKGDRYGDLYGSCDRKCCLTAIFTRHIVSIRINCSFHPTRTC